MKHILELGILPSNKAILTDNLNRYTTLNSGGSIIDQLAAFTATILDTPIAVINYIGTDIMKIKQHEEKIEKEQATNFCSVAILNEESTILESKDVDPCMLTNPLLAAENGLKFYAAAPLLMRHGYSIGTLCVADKKQRKFSKEKQDELKKIAELIATEIEKGYQNV